MPTIKVQATKMGSANAQFISLVERGANRIPFKIIKQEKDMAGFTKGLDLGNIFARKSETKDKSAQVVAVVTMKGEGMESIKKQVEAAGFAVADMQEMDDGSVVFKQDGDMEGETTVVRLNDHVAVVTKGFRPYSMDMDVGNGTSFAEACAAQGFYPGVRTIVDVLASSISSAADAAATPADAAKAVGKMFDEAKAYTVAFMNGLPVKAFKLETIAPEPTAKGEAAPPQEEPAVPEHTCTDCGSATKQPDMALKSDGTVGEVCKACATKQKPNTKDGKPGSNDMADGGTEGAEGTDGAQGDNGKKAKKTDGTPGDESSEAGLTEEQVSSIVASQMEGVVTTLSKKLEEALAGVTKGVQESLAGVTSTVEDLSGRVAKAEAEASKAQSAVQGTIVVGSESGDPEVAAKKSESGSVFGGREIDTAYMGHTRKRASR